MIDPRQLKFPETSFKFLMQKRIYKVLIICSNYEFFMLEEDGRIDEQIFKEYVSLNLSSPPQFIQADTSEKALKILEDESIDLVITMLAIGNLDAYTLAGQIKKIHPGVPIVVLTPFSREVMQQLKRQDQSAIDYVFYWLGNMDILLAIIKLIEDKMNVRHDVKEVGVQIILLVEDSIRFYSSYLPTMYKIILKQSRFFMTEGLNDFIEKLRMRGRPKILLATTYEEAHSIFLRYKDNMLGIISDIRYKHNGTLDPEAGLKLCRKIREKDKFMPFILQSSDLKNKIAADKLGVDFLHKFSKTLSIELSDFLSNNFSFGDFVFRNPDDKREIGRASNLQEMQNTLPRMPLDSLRHHFNRNDLSRWLNARALFSIAKVLRHLTLDDFSSVPEATSYLLQAISHYRSYTSRGVIARFETETYDKHILFARIGEGSLGGKARGLAFIDSFLKKHHISSRFEGVEIMIPRTVVLCTDIFDEFMESNDLYNVALKDLPDEEILEHFIKADFSNDIINDLRLVVSVFEKPIAIRSSSLLEDSHYQPFAGIYSTYMVPNDKDHPDLTLKHLSNAIKSVYASVFYKESKTYMEITKNVIDEEKMAIIIQELCGTKYDGLYYPTLSGIGRSINFYPISPEKYEDGIAKIAHGLGKIIVEGGRSLRFSPKFPKKVLQLSSPASALQETQKYIFALNLDPESFRPDVDDGINLEKMRIRDIEKNPNLKYVASSYDYNNNIIRPGIHYEGKKLITFDYILQHKTFPLAKILQTLLKQGQKEMNNPIEIEFAANLDTKKNTLKEFYFLQIRPVVESSDDQKVKLNRVDPSDTIIYSKSALGNGVIRNLRDVVYVKTIDFNPANNPAVARVIHQINEQFLHESSNYILVGPGRWGSQDPWLGIPVKWPSISASRLIVESGLANYRIDPSQGTHFFQNLTSFRIGYFTINPYVRDGYYDIDFLDKKQAVYEDEFVRHVRLEDNMLIKIDGKKKLGVVFKPGFAGKSEEDELP